MSTNEVIKKSVYERFQSGNISITSIIITLCVAILLGLFIYFIYRITTRSGFYNRNLNKTLATMPVITAGIMLAMQSSLVIGLGMVGALSIIRVRNTVKDPIDLTYLFWSISIGIIVGTGLFDLACILSLCMTVLIFLLDMLPAFRPSCILVVSAERNFNEQQLMDAVKKYNRHASVRSRNISARSIEIVLELQVKNQFGLINAVSRREGVISVNLLSHDGDVRF